ncbi:phage late control gene D protein [Trabulsiella guamensis ATCC 49490]|uniref:Phage late control gene D protein n=1 Tax=Trabulsiella guamensis ATCC 49490 TaxID=1005994 RepID=A0A085A808_9ENTR|nr:hypothetical protein [Trabulsiella guamensis]KFC06353.1 phage late control gene D protein [Trabulsiella guamensis ATCC 49490]
MVKIGKFKITTITLQLYPRIITITATSAPFDHKDSSMFRERRTKSWDDTMLGAIFHEIAVEHNLSPRMDPQLADVYCYHADQINETDSAFLNRLAEEHDAVAKPVNGAYILALRGESKSITGITLPVIKLTCPPENIPGNQRFIQCSVDEPGKKNVKGIRVRYTDEATGKTHTIEHGDPPFRTMPAVFENKEHTEAVLKGGKRKAKRNRSKLRLDIPGDPYIAAEGMIEMDDSFPGGMRGRVSIDRVEVRCSRGDGYRMSITASKPVADKK